LKFFILIEGPRVRYNIRMPQVTVDLPSDTLYDACAYVLDMPEDIHAAFQGATLLGRGASSVAWRLPNGDVFKITPDPVARDFLAWQQAEQHPHLVRVHRHGAVRVALSGMNHRDDAWEAWSYAIQPYYAGLTREQWGEVETVGSAIGASGCKSRPGWCRTKDGLMAHGVLAKTHLDALQKAFEHSLVNNSRGKGIRHEALQAVAALATWWAAAKTRHAGLDIDKMDNWGIDVATGSLVALDPVYGNDRAESTCHWNAEYY
jgi:hypothetical protein